VTFASADEGAGGRFVRYTAATCNLREFVATPPEEDCMPRAPLLIVIAPLFACAGTIAAAQGGRQWVDPPAPASEPALEERGPAESLAPAAAPRKRSLEPSLAGQAKKEPVIGAGARAPAGRREAEIRRPDPPRSAERSTRVPARKERLAGGPAPRPSFNCRSARSSVERTICADPALAAKDRRMASLYEQAGGSRKGPVDRPQWRWLAARNACGRAPALQACIDQVYDARIAELSSELR
jgi:hypothetical protein